MNRTTTIALIIIAFLGLLAYASAFTVHMTEQVIVMQFGDPKRVITEPGLNFKIPIVQNIESYEKRVLNLDPPVESVLLSDQKRILMDSFARYRIHDALQFFQRVRSENVARQRLGGIVNAAMREALGNATLATVLSEEREAILASVRAKVNADATPLGIEIVDVRLRRADLPDETSQAVYDRMESERKREAAEFRAQGFELAQRIKATADREATVIRAEAEREAEIQRGLGEGQRTVILNDSYGQDPDFFSFYRSMQAYEGSFASDSTYMVLSPDSDFFRFFEQADRIPTLPLAVE